ncbi:MAG: hypothetical protein KDB27_27955 [Planctomycetales bacterium]|nr:hypothetical protein [Planctomycetales bacterium]
MIGGRSAVLVTDIEQTIRSEFCGGKIVTDTLGTTVQDTGRLHELRHVAIVRMAGSISMLMDNPRHIVLKVEPDSGPRNAVGSDHDCAPQKTAVAPA